MELTYWYKIRRKREFLAALKVEKEFATIIHEKLVAKFRDELVSESILVQTYLDLNSDSDLYAYIVFVKRPEKAGTGLAKKLPGYGAWPRSPAMFPERFRKPVSARHSGLRGGLCPHAT